jgi:hypothetical protein
MTLTVKTLALVVGCLHAASNGDLASVHCTHPMVLVASAAAFLANHKL